MGDYDVVLTLSDGIPAHLATINLRLHVNELMPRPALTLEIPSGPFVAHNDEQFLHTLVVEGGFGAKRFRATNLPSWLTLGEITGELIGFPEGISLGDARERLEVPRFLCAEIASS